VEPQLPPAGVAAALAPLPTPPRTDREVERLEPFLEEREFERRDVDAARSVAETEPATAGAARTGPVTGFAAEAAVELADAAGVAVFVDGAIPSSRIDRWARSEKTGPAVALPLLPGGVSSSITVIET